MLTVTVEPDLAEQITQLADNTQRSADEVVAEALHGYFAQRRWEKIQSERAAFEQQRDGLLNTYPGQYVAIHEGRVMDHDPNLRALHLRVFEHLGHTPVLLKQVTGKPEREWLFRSPRLER